jgi:hypothetical protein
MDAETQALFRAEAQSLVESLEPGSFPCATAPATAT